MRIDASLLLSLIVMFASGGAVLAATTWPWKASLFPFVIGVPLFLLAAAEFCLTALGRVATDVQAADLVLSQDVDRSVARRRTVATFGWLLGVTLLIIAVGFSLAIPIFVLLYLRIHASEGWARSLTLAVVAWVFVYGLFVRLLDLPFSEGWVQLALSALGVPR